MSDLQRFRKRAIELLESIVESADAGAFGKDFVWNEGGYTCGGDCGCVICEARELLRDEGILDAVTPPSSGQEGSDG